MSIGIRTGLVASLLVAASAGAQSSLAAPAAPAARLPATVVSVSAGALRYDFNKFGMAPLVTLGLEHRFGSNLIVAIEASLGAGFRVRPENAPTDYDAVYTSTLLSAQWQASAGRFQPYAGIGAGYYNLGMSPPLNATPYGCLDSSRYSCVAPRTHRYGAIESAMLGSRFSLTAAALLRAEFRLSHNGVCSSSRILCQTEMRLGIGHRF